MARDSRYDILFEPVQIGPVTAKNRFYQVPHCNGTSDGSPKAVARMRGVKAEGGWGVVCTEVAGIHPTSEFWPFPSLRLWDDSDIALQSLMPDAVHEHGALAGIELGHIGLAAGNRFHRATPLGPSSQPTLESVEPFQTRAMDKADIKNLRRWHRDAAIRSKKAGFDIIYVYCSHNLALPMHFLSRRYNDRNDEYGGSLENRARLLRELLEDTKEAVGDRCAVAVRFSVDEMSGPEGLTCDGEGREVVEMLAEVPDLWDVNLSDWSYDSASSRFAKEGFQESYISFVKQVTSKPVVGVGRFTSPDSMVSQIKRGIVDFIGAARPSIADPFLPKKIEEGRAEDIRECIGCNICITGEMSYSPIRCTQNPTMMEEWRRDWHPEDIEPKRSNDSVLVVGAGPAGLECTLALGQRGYGVTLAEAKQELGGRVTHESHLPGLAEWARVRDYRHYQLQQLGNVEIYHESRMAAADVLETGSAHVVIATGAAWRRDGLGRQHGKPIPGSDQSHVYGPADIMADAALTGPVLVYDDDGTHLASALAEQLQADGLAVTYVTPASEVARWTFLTLEQPRIYQRFVERGIEILTMKELVEIGAGEVDFACVYSGRREKRAAASVVLVTSRIPNDALYHELASQGEALAAAGVKSLRRIGDCLAPNTIAAAIYEGHRYARELDVPPSDGLGFATERALP